MIINSEEAETMIYNLSIVLDNRGTLYADISSCEPEELQKVLDEWDPEYPLTPKLIKLVRELKRVVPDLIQQIELEVQSI